MSSLLILMSAIGPKQTSATALHMSALGGKADIASAARLGALGLLGWRRRRRTGYQGVVHDTNMDRLFSPNYVVPTSGKNYT